MKIILGSRRDHYLARVSVFLIILALVAGMLGCTPSQNPEIRTWYDLDAIRNNLGGSYILMSDLDSTTPGYEELASPTANQGKGWQPIGTYLGPGSYPFGGFTGTFDGQGYEIRDLFIKRPDEHCIGLFGALDAGGVIKDTSTMNITAIGDYYVGGLVGANNQGTVSNSYSAGSVRGSDQVGGLVGWSTGTVSNSYSTVNVTANTAVGGLVGQNSGTVSRSYCTGSVSGNVSVGGLVGANWDGTVSNSYYNYDEVLINGENIISIGGLFDRDFEEWLANDKFLDVNERLSQEDDYYVINDVGDFKQLLAFGQDNSLKFRLKNDLDLTDEPNFYIPYLAGEFDGNGHKISNLSFNFGFISQVGLFGYIGSGGKVTKVGVENVNVTSASWWVGGLAGFSAGAVSDSHSSGSVTGNMYVGGLMGANWDVTMSNSYSTSSVNGNEGVGGLVGANWDGIVRNSYSTGNVTGNKYVGGLAGQDMGVGHISNSFWDIETSGQATSPGGTGKITAEMQDIATFSGATWNITAVVNPGTRNPAYIWNIVDKETYPFLSWQA
jgi:hypothetical protein